MAYNPPTFKTNPTITTSAGNTPNTGLASNFSNLRVDAGRNAMTGVLGNFMQTQDATGTPVTSPVTVNTTKTIAVPTNAAQFIVSPVTNPVQVSEDSTQTAYFAVPAGQTITFDCANMTNIYLKTSGSTVVSFYFNCV